MFAFHIFNNSLNLSSDLSFSLSNEANDFENTVSEKSFLGSFYRFSAGSTPHFPHLCNSYDRYSKVYLRKYSVYYFHTYII